MNYKKVIDLLNSKCQIMDSGRLFMNVGIQQQIYLVGNISPKDSSIMASMLINTELFETW